MSKLTFEFGIFYFEVFNSWTSDFLEALLNDGKELLTIQKYFYTIVKSLLETLLDEVEAGFI